MDTERKLHFLVRAIPGGPVDDARIRFKGFNGAQIRTLDNGRASVRYIFKNVGVRVMRATKEGFKTSLPVKFRVFKPE